MIGKVPTRFSFRYLIAIFLIFPYQEVLSCHEKEQEVRTHFYCISGNSQSFEAKELDEKDLSKQDTISTPPIIPPLNEPNVKKSMIKNAADKYINLLFSVFEWGIK